MASKVNTVEVRSCTHISIKDNKAVSDKQFQYKYEDGTLSFFAPTKNTVINTSYNSCNNSYNNSFSTTIRNNNVGGSVNFFSSVNCNNCSFGDNMTTYNYGTHSETYVDGIKYEGNSISSLGNGFVLVDGVLYKHGKKVVDTNESAKEESNEKTNENKQSKENPNVVKELDLSKFELSLSKIEVCGSSSLNIDCSSIISSSLRVRCSGSSRLNINNISSSVLNVGVSGGSSSELKNIKTSDCNIKVNSGSSLQLSDMTSQDTVVELSGGSTLSGNNTVFESVQCEIYGASTFKNVTIKGDIRGDVSGASTVYISGSRSRNYLNKNGFSTVNVH